MGGLACPTYQVDEKLKIESILTLYNGIIGITTTYRYSNRVDRVIELLSEII